MAELAIWLQLSRIEQRLLTRLFGGGSVRGAHPANLDCLSAHGLIDKEGLLTLQGLEVFKAAYKLQNLRIAA